MKIVWLKPANQDLLDAIAWLNARNPTAAKRITQHIYEQIKQLQQYPQSGRHGRVADTRELVIQHTRYIIVYRLNAATQTIEILALMHAAQHWPDTF